MIDVTERWSLVDLLCQEQQELTPVERFAQRHVEMDQGSANPLFRELIPLTAPKPGEQYAFEVDLDACSGCKACVAACHQLNGLDEHEMWRKVGLLHGGGASSAVVQHVTTACHHCVEPACLSGCPVNAYEKDPVTGIVRHLDDQCIGCQYCVLKCPYDVPQYNATLGIVRKCDMCHGRLAVGQAPACVQACPNQAIRVTLVEVRKVIDECEANQFLPGAPEPGYTLPTTVYKSQRPLPRNLLPADYYAARPEHAHMPLVMMLVLTQTSVGAFVVAQALAAGWWGGTELAPAMKPTHLLVGWLLGMAGLAASTFHLGRPMYAFRAWIGLRTSWLSREIVAFGAFAAFATVQAALAWLGEAEGWRTLEVWMGWAAATSGAVGVFCSAMIYADTRRPFWNLPATGSKFLLTGLLLGLPLALGASLAAAGWSDELTVKEVMVKHGRSMVWGVLFAAAAKMVVEGWVLMHLRDLQHTPLKRTARLLTGELGATFVQRTFLLALGGVLCPLMLLGETPLTSTAGYSPAFIGVVVALTFGLLFVGEFMERYLFFTAVVAPKMPGAPAA